MELSQTVAGLPAIPLRAGGEGWRRWRPIAALLEAVSRVAETRALYEPDPFSSEVPFLSDFWPYNKG